MTEEKNFKDLEEFEKMLRGQLGDNSSFRHKTSILDFYEKLGSIPSGAVGLIRQFRQICFAEATDEELTALAAGNKEWLIELFEQRDVAREAVQYSERVTSDREDQRILDEGDPAEFWERLKKL